jgi:hypothetical protein
MNKFIGINVSRVKMIRELFGEYIVDRQRAENLHKPLQCYKDDYVLELLHHKNHKQHIEVVIGTHASDLKLFDIK